MRALLAAALLASAPAAAQDTALPAWLSGCWSEQKINGWTEECWTAPRAGLMMGSASNGSGDKLEMFEHTRIERGTDGKLSFVAMPRGAAGSRFPAVGQGADWIEFANAEHDYPQRIRYWREGAKLRARISRIDGAQAFEWTFRRTGRSAR